MRVVRETLLWAAAAMGACLLTAVVASALFGIKPLVFRSGSMSPAITTGSLAFAHSVPATDLRVGDIVSVPVDGSLVTHRITEIDRHGGRAALTLKGDANTVADSEPYDVASAERVFFHTPRLGYLVEGFGHGVGLLVGVSLACVMLLWLCLGRRDVTGRRGRHRLRRMRTSRGARTGAPVLALIAVLMLAGATVTVVRAQPAWAYWTDDAAAGSGQFIAYSVPAPALSCSGGLVGSVKFSWPSVPNASGYLLIYDIGNGPTPIERKSYETSYTLKSPTLGLLVTGRAWLVAIRDFPQVAWVSMPSNSWNFSIPLSVLGIGVASSCSRP